MKMNYPFPGSGLKWVAAVGLAIGLVVSAAHGDGETYDYDALGRIITVTYNDGAVMEYVYDNNGNRLVKSIRVGGAATNHPPLAVTQPGIADGATNVATRDLVVAWTGVTDPDPGDSVSYGLYLGTNAVPLPAWSGWETNYTVERLAAFTRYYWRVTSRDSQNASTSSVTWSFVTGNAVPQADFAASPRSTWVPAEVFFTDTSVSPDDPITVRAWDFNNDGHVDATNQHPVHVYTNAGFYTVRLDVQDEHGAAATMIKTNYIEVYDDSDYDGIVNTLDNCPYTYNPGQRDMNTNGVGDVCDPDMDSDGIPNDTDNVPWIPNPDQADSDHDGYGDAGATSHCVCTSAELQAALTAAATNGLDDVVHLVQGLYRVPDNGGAAFTYRTSESNQLVLLGGYLATGCAVRVTNAVATILDGEQTLVNGDGGILNLVAEADWAFANLVLDSLTLRGGHAYHYGGGAYAHSTFGGIQARNLLVYSNLAVQSGGLLLEAVHGAIEVGKCVVQDNTADYFGGAWLHSANGTITVRNNLFARNQALYYGGGLTFDVAYGSSVVENNTLVANEAHELFAPALYMIMKDCADVHLRNNIIWTNLAPDEWEIEVDDRSRGDAYAWHNDIMLFETFKFKSLIGNISLWPAFKNPAAGDYALASDSPCIDVGTNQTWMATATDLAAQARVIHDIVDMGAFEFNPALSGLRALPWLMLLME